MRIVELQPAEMARAFPVMQELRTHLDEEQYASYLSDMVADGYRLFAREDADGRILALAGIALRTNFYYGRYAWVYDLVTSSRARSQGHGAALLAEVEKISRAAGCRAVALSSNFERVDAHRFYEDKMGYKRASYVFKKNLR